MVKHMSSLLMENENRQLQEMIVSLRRKLESNFLEMQKKAEQERLDFDQIIAQLQSTIVELRGELEFINTKNMKKIETVKINKNNEINQLQNTIRELRNKLETAFFIEPPVK